MYTFIYLNLKKTSINFLRHREKTPVNKLFSMAKWKLTLDKIQDSGESSTFF